MGVCNFVSRHNRSLSNATPDGEKSTDRSKCKFINKSKLTYLLPDKKITP